MSTRHLVRLFLVFLLPGAAPIAMAADPPVAAFEVYGAWHCGSDLCTWGSVRDMTEFDQKNHWLIDRDGKGGAPAVNLVVLSFVEPLKLLNRTTDTMTLNGVPRGMTSAVVNYFASRGVRVMLSIGGITYVKPWNQALGSASSAWQLGLNAAQVASDLHVGIEIDYEENRSPNLAGLQSFIDAYRSVHPYDPSGVNPEARLTIDLAAGDRWLIDITRKASADWLSGATPVLDYANAMVPARQPSVKDAVANWREHVDGKSQYAPPIRPLAPARFTGSLWLVGSKPIAECTNFANSLQNSTGGFVTSAAPNGEGSSPGMLGYMFWASECEGSRTVCTTPQYKSTCEGGVGVGATTYRVKVPMPALTRY